MENKSDVLTLSFVYSSKFCIEESERCLRKFNELDEKIDERKSDEIFKVMFWKNKFFELSLFSLELSMKTIAWFHLGDYPKIHDLYRLFQKIENEVDGFDNLLTSILDEINEMCVANKIPHISKDELKRKLERYRDTYEKVRYWGIGKQGDVSYGGMIQDDMMIIYYMAIGFHNHNGERMEKT